MYSHYQNQPSQGQPMIRQILTLLVFLSILALYQPVQCLRLNNPAAHHRRQAVRTASATFTGLNNNGVSGTINFTQKSNNKGLDVNLAVSGLESFNLTEFLYHIHINKADAQCQGGGDIFDDLSGTFGSLKPGNNSSNSTVRRSGRKSRNSTKTNGNNSLIALTKNFTDPSLSFTDTSKKNPIGHTFMIHKGTEKTQYVACAIIA